MLTYARAAMRSVAYPWIQVLLRGTVKAFFRRVEVGGTDNVPREGGGLVVSWHPNGLVDPGLILTQFPRPIVFGARHGLFKYPLLGTLLKEIGTVPIYRAIDMGKSSPDARREANRKSLEALAGRVADGSFSALFPEGVSHDEPDLQMLRSGAARLYYRARQLTPEGQPPPVIIMAGLHYDDKQMFRSNALVTFFKPLSLPAELDVTPEGDIDSDEVRELGRKLTEHIEETLRDVVHATDSWELHDLMHRTRRLVRAERACRAGADPGKTTIGERVLGFARVRAGYYDRLRSDPAGVESMIKRVGDYDKDLRALGLEDYDLDRDPGLPNKWLAALLGIQMLAVFFLLPPLVVFGYLVNLPTAGLLVLAAKAAAKKKKDEATVKLLLGTLLYPVTWILAGIGGAVLHHQLHLAFPRLPDTAGLAGLTIALLGALGGAAALRYWRVARETAPRRPRPPHPPPLPRLHRPPPQGTRPPLRRGHRDGRRRRPPRRRRPRRPRGSELERCRESGTRPRANAPGVEDNAAGRTGAVGGPLVAAHEVEVVDRDPGPRPEVEGQVWHQPDPEDELGRDLGHGADPGLGVLTGAPLRQLHRGQQAPLDAERAADARSHAEHGGDLVPQDVKVIDRRERPTEHPVAHAELDEPMHGERGLERAAALPREAPSQSAAEVSERQPHTADFRWRVPTDTRRRARCCAGRLLLWGSGRLGFDLRVDVHGFHLDVDAQGDGEGARAHDEPHCLDRGLHRLRRLRHAPSQHGPVTHVEVHDVLVVPAQIEPEHAGGVVFDRCVLGGNNPHAQRGGALGRDRHEVDLVRRHVGPHRRHHVVDPLVTPLRDEDDDAGHFLLVSGRGSGREQDPDEGEPGHVSVFSRRTSGRGADVPRRSCAGRAGALHRTPRRRARMRAGP